MVVGAGGEVARSGAGPQKGRELGGLYICSQRWLEAVSRLPCREGTEAGPGGLAKLRHQGRGLGWLRRAVWSRVLGRRGVHGSGARYLPRSPARPLAGCEALKFREEWREVLGSRKSRQSSELAQAWLAVPWATACHGNQ